MTDPMKHISIMPPAEALQDLLVDLDPASAIGVDPVQVKETSGAPHLVAAIHRDRVVNKGGYERIVPGRGAVVKICPGVLGDVQAAPPQVNMELVGMRGARRELRRPQISPGVLPVNLVAKVAGQLQVFR